MNAQELLDRFNSFDVDNTLKEITYDSEDEILDLINQQLEKGIDSEGNIIGVYAPATENFAREDPRARKKEFGRPYNLDWYGDFRRSFEINYQKDKMVFYATDNKTSTIFDTVEKYGFLSNANTIVGLTVENGEVVNFDILKPELQKRFKEHLG